MARDNLKASLRGNNNKTGLLLENKPLEIIVDVSEHELMKIKNRNISILRELILSRQRTETVRKNYSELYHQSPIALFTLSPEGKITKLNHKGTQLLSRGIDEILNTPFESYLTNKSKIIFRDLFLKMLKKDFKGSCTIELLTNLNQTKIGIATGICTKNSSHYLFYIQDITQLKYIESQLIESEKTFKKTQEIAHVGSWKWHIKENRLEWSDEMFRIFGINKDKFSGNLIEVIQHSIHPDDRSAVERSNLSVISHKKPIPLEYRIIWPNGTIRTVWAEAGELILDDKGKAVILTGIVKDITEHKNIENEFKDAHEVLKMLYVHQDDIRENERKAISREIHDELGQFLTALKFDLNWVKDNTDTKENATAKINGMIDIVNDSIKSVQRISSELRPGLLDDLGLVPAMEWHCQEFEKRSGIKCYFKSTVAEINNPKKSLALYRILQETLTNVLRHSQANAVIVKLNQHAGRTILEINDNGIGIPQEKINSNKSLGLTGIKERVKHYGGFYNIHSFKNEGTNILITIPAD